MFRSLWSFLNLFLRVFRRTSNASSDNQHIEPELTSVTLDCPLSEREKSEINLSQDLSEKSSEPILHTKENNDSVKLSFKNTPETNIPVATAETDEVVIETVHTLDTDDNLIVESKQEQETQTVYTDTEDEESNIWRKKIQQFLEGQLSPKSIFSELSIEKRRKHIIEVDRVLSNLIDECLQQYKDKRITLFERALRLTDLDLIKEDVHGYPVEYYSPYKLYKEYSHQFTISDIYEVDIEENLVAKLILVVNARDKYTFIDLLKKHSISDYSTNTEDDLVFFQFYRQIPRPEVQKFHEQIPIRFIREELVKLLDPTIYYLSPVGIYTFRYVVELMGLRPIFGKHNYELIHPYNKLEYALYLALNNGCQIYKLRNDLRKKSAVPPQYYWDLDNVFRSTWEANIARLLNFKGIEWKYEPEMFLLDTDNRYILPIDNIPYIPDFMLTDKLAIEVKGFWDPESVLKIHYFKKQYPDIALKIIDSDIYYTLNELYSETVPNWEYSQCSKRKETIKVVGLMRPDVRPHVKNLKLFEDVFLERERDNEYDPNAIRIYNSSNNLIGYIVAEWASIYAEKMDLGMKFKGVVVKKEPRVISITIERTNLEEPIIYDFLKIDALTV